MTIIRVRYCLNARGWCLLSSSLTTKWTLVSFCKRSKADERALGSKKVKASIKRSLTFTTISSAGQDQVKASCYPLFNPSAEMPTRTKILQSNSQVRSASGVFHPSITAGLTSWVSAQQDLKRTFERGESCRYSCCELRFGRLASKTCWEYHKT